MNNTKSLIEAALEQAQTAAAAGESAVGAALAKENELIAVGRHRVRASNDPVAHAAMDCIRHAGRRIDYPELRLYLTLAPCMMCAGTLLQFGIGSVVIGAQPSNDEIVELLSEKGVRVEVLNDAACQELMVKTS